MLSFGLLRAHLFLGSFPAFGYLWPVTGLFGLWAKFSPWLHSARLWPVNQLGCFHSVIKCGLLMTRYGPRIVQPMFLRNDYTPRRRPMDPTACRRPMDPTARRRPMDHTARRKSMDPTARRRPMDPTARRRPMDPMARRRPTDPMARRRPTDPTARRRPMVTTVCVLP